ncbi:MAG: NADH-quinone oxidoreductase subunit 5 family protein [Phycisphaerae bacterium]
MPTAHYLLAATLLPLAGFLLLIFLGRRIGKGGRLAGPLASLLLLGSFSLSIAALVTWVAKPESHHAHYVEALTVRWISLPADVAPQLPPAPSSSADLTPATPAPAFLAVGCLVDSLTIVMFLLITLVGLLVHLFSIPYMAADIRQSRFFAYLGFFSFAILSLVLSNSLPQIFFFWVLAGISSWLLIGFWTERRGPATAAFKSFLVNAIGDASFLVGLGILLTHIGANALTLFDAEGTSTLVHGVSNAIGVGPSEFLYFTTNIATPNAPGFFLGLHWLTWAGLFLFGGAAAKSAQFPLHVWLPDAMDAPSPASAFLHGSILVGAGVYLVARLYPILTMDARLVIAVIGCVTLFMAALIALVQTDIKRLLAWSTISQLGFMMLFLGSGGYVAALLHLIAHGFFKTCLFLGAGSVLHALKNERRIDQMGGLWRKLPITAAATLLASLAAIAAPGFSGAYSTRLGLAGVFDYASALNALTHGAGLTHNGGGYAMLLYWTPVVTLYITAFYMARFWWLVFAGKSRNEKLAEDADESPLMTFPLILLAALSTGAWVVYFHMPDLLAKSLAGDVRTVLPSPDLLARMYDYNYSRYFLLAPIGAALLAVLLYLPGLTVAHRIRRFPGINFFYLWLREKMFLDALYAGTLLAATLLAANIAAFLDRYLLNLLTPIANPLTKLFTRATARLPLKTWDAVLSGPVPSTRRSSEITLSPRAIELRKHLLLAVAFLLFLTLLTLSVLLLRY